MSNNMKKTCFALCRWIFLTKKITWIKRSRGTYLENLSCDNSCAIFFFC